MTKLLTRAGVIVAAAVLSFGFTAGAAHADISWGRGAAAPVVSK